MLYTIDQMELKHHRKKIRSHRSTGNPESRSHSTLHRFAFKRTLKLQSDCPCEVRHLGAQLRPQSQAKSALHYNMIESFLYL